MFKKILKNAWARFWFIETCILVALMIAVTVLMTAVFPGMMNILFGWEIAVYSDEYAPIFTKESLNKNEALRRADALNEQVCEEGIVLLKNDGALPLANGARISVFGKNSVDLVYGGSGSGGGDWSDARTLAESLDAAGFAVNPALPAFYKNTAASGAKRQNNPDDLDSGADVALSTAETPYSAYGRDVTGSYAAYDDAALVVISRIGGEGFDLPRSSPDDPTRHYLELDPNERDLLRAVTAAGFGKVIVVVNSSAATELGFVDGGELGKIDACLTIGGPGGAGVMALGRVLNGEVNPSGRAVDTYARDFTRDPTFRNFGTNGVKGGDAYTVDGKAKQYYRVDYEEGIYVGYRYYETRGLTDGEDWYKDNVVYPFGYGLSYTRFDWRAADPFGGRAVDADGKYAVKVTVTNTGDRAGKDVVQLYASAPYAAGGIEKPHKVLVGFAKTPTLYPADERDKGPDSCELTIKFDPYFLASYDYNDADGNGFYGYELEKGDYTLYVARNAHDNALALPFSVDATINYAADPATGAAVINRFDDAAEPLGATLSRSAWDATWPAPPTAAELATDEAFLARLDDRTPNAPAVTAKMPTTGAAVTLDMFGLIYADDYAGYDDPRWAALLDALTVDEMANLFNNGAFHSEAILKISKPKTTEADGPVGFTTFLNDPTIYDTCAYASQVVMASTWNTELIYEVGRSVGEEGLFGNEKGDKMPYSGWYAPGANLHRSPFGGRNFEYFSEDGFLSGMMAASEIAGAASKGVYCYIKHFAVNEQETHRSLSGLCTYLTEQSLRELYLRPFEMAVKIGKTRGVMSSFNRIGTRWTGGDYRLLTEVLRQEWGFEGTVVCDFNTNSYMALEQMIYAGGDLNLSTTRFWEKYDPKDAADVSVLRRAAKNILFTTAGSNAMNGKITAYLPPVWFFVLIGVDAAITVMLIVGDVITFRRALKKGGEEDKHGRAY